MVTRNFYNAILNMCAVTSSSDSDSTFGEGHFSLKNVNGNIYSGATFNSSVYTPYSMLFVPSYATNNSAGVVFGSGTTPPTFDDYKLENRIYFTCSALSVGATAYDATTKKFSKTISFVITNDTGSSQTVNEVGMYGGFGTNNGSYLFSREVLDTPFTIAAGESVTYTHKFEFALPEIS